MTTRLYYSDAMRRTFDAAVVACDRRDGRVEVLLDRTAFYPTSGGQPFDTGTLGGQRVVEVVERDDGEVVHVVGDVMPIGARVAGEIDWARRFDHMQQHTGQHVLSAAFERVLGVRTVSFHLGADASTIDLAREVSPSEIARVEEEANRFVWEDRPVTVRFADADDAARLPLRKASERTGELRLVEIADVDLSACGGTHVPSTGMIGIVAVAGWERFKGGSRIAFVCGGRALRSHASFRDATAAAARLLSVGPGELPAAIERLQSDARAAAKTVQHLEREISLHRASALRAGAETINGISVVLTVQPVRDAGALKRLAAAIVDAPGVIALVVGEGQPAPVVMARSPDIRFDAGAWLKRATEVLGGRGGGRPDHAQGGLTAAPEAILDFARESMMGKFT